MSSAIVSYVFAILVCLMAAGCGLSIGFCNLRNGRKKFAAWQISLGALCGIEAIVIVVLLFTGILEF